MLQLSLLLFLAVSSAGCQTAPQVSATVLDPANGVGYRTDVRTGKQDTVLMRDMRGWTAYSPGDTRTLIEWIKRQLSKK